MMELDAWKVDCSGRIMACIDGLSKDIECVGRSAIALMLDERLHQALSILFMEEDCFSGYIDIELLYSIKQYESY